MMQNARGGHRIEILNERQTWHILRGLKIFVLTEVLSFVPHNSQRFVRIVGLLGTTPIPTTLNKMAWWSGKIEQLW